MLSAGLMLVLFFEHNNMFYLLGGNSTIHVHNSWRVEVTIYHGKTLEITQFVHSVVSRC